MRGHFMVEEERLNVAAAIDQSQDPQSQTSREFDKERRMGKARPKSGRRSLVTPTHHGNGCEELEPGKPGTTKWGTTMKMNREAGVYEGGEWEDERARARRSSETWSEEEINAGSAGKRIVNARLDCRMPVPNQMR